MRAIYSFPNKNPLYNSKNRGNIRSLSGEVQPCFKKRGYIPNRIQAWDSVDPIETSFPIRSNLIFAIKRPRKGWN